MSRALPSRQVLLAHADLLLLTADLLRDPRGICLPDADEAMKVVASARPGGSGVADLLEKLITSAYESSRNAWIAEYYRLFEGSIACPINEAAYIRRDKGALLADISGFYLAFGLAHAKETGERPDHLRCELEFVAMLLVMLAKAEQSAREDQEVTLGALQSFLADHLGEWLESFCARMESTTSLPLYAHLAEFSTSLLRNLASLLSFPAPKSADHSEPEWPPPEEEELRCGMGAGKAPVACTVSASAAEGRDAGSGAKRT